MSISRFVISNLVQGIFKFILKLDEMAIRKGLRHIPHLNRILGYVDYGEGYKNGKILESLKSYFDGKDDNENEADDDENDGNFEPRLASKALFSSFDASMLI